MLSKSVSNLMGHKVFVSLDCVRTAFPGVILLLYCVLFYGFAFAVTPTAEQIQQFQNLTPQQQEALKRSLRAGQGGSVLASPLPVSPVQTVIPVKREAESILEKRAEKATERPALQEKKSEKRIENPLNQFGYDLFSGEPTTFAPVTDIPIPIDYVLGPGDVLQVLLTGKLNSEHQLRVNRDGNINFPGLGLIQVAGLSFERMNMMLDSRLKEQMVGVRASITMGQLRSIRIFVLGDVQRPGSYTVSALSTMTNAMFVSGGITKVGSLRNIQLKRRGEVVTTLDLYELLLRGDTQSDLRLQPGDVLFVPPVGKIVGITGEVTRPALYELKGEKSVGEMVEMAGGLLSTAYQQGAQIERLDSERGRVMIDLNLKDPRQRGQVVKDGDVIKVYPLLNKVDDVVQLTGQLYRPGFSQWFQGMRLSDVIRREQDLLMDADSHYVVINREQHGSRQIVTTNLQEAWRQPGSGQDLMLIPRDEVIVLSQRGSRMAVIGRLVDQILAQNSHGERKKVVKLIGNVRYPGTYPFTERMRIGDLIDAAMGVQPGTDMGYALLRRVSGVERRVEVKAVSLSEINQRKESGENLLLEPEDQLLVLSLEGERDEQIRRLVDDLKRQETLEEPAQMVRVEGNVRMPGEYPLTSGMRVGDLLRASRYPLPETDMEYALLRRVSGVERRVEVKAVSLSEINQRKESGENLLLEPEDQLLVLSLEGERDEQIRRLVDDLKRQETLEEPAQMVRVEGNVRMPGEYPLTSGMRVGDLLRASRYPLPETDMEYALLRRVSGVERLVEVYAVSLHKIAQAPRGDEDLLLKPEDQLLVLSLKESRSEHIARFIDDLKAQTSKNRLAPYVEIVGAVRFPGQYPLEVTMGIGDLLRAAGGLLESAYTISAELTKRVVVDGEQFRETQHRTVSLDEPLVLEAYDTVIIKQIPSWGRVKRVTVEGEVRFPGTYPFSQGETLYDVIRRAGGMTEHAFPQGAVLMRENLRVKEQKQLEASATLLEKEVALLAKEQEVEGERSTEIEAARSLLEQVRQSRAVGRLSIQLQELLKQREGSLILKEDDHLVIPSMSQEVTVMGEVFHPTSHLFKSGKSWIDYVNLSGGVTKFADDQSIYVIRADGSVMMTKRLAWFRATHEEEIQPGDTVVVPVDMKPTHFMSQLKDISQVLYQLATTTAALQTVGVF